MQFWIHACFPRDRLVCADPADPDFSRDGGPAVEPRDIVQAPGLAFHLLKKVSDAPALDLSTHSRQNRFAGH